MGEVLPAVMFGWEWEEFKLANPFLPHLPKPAIKFMFRMTFSPALPLIQLPDSGPWKMAFFMSQGCPQKPLFRNFRSFFLNFILNQYSKPAHKEVEGEEVRTWMKPIQCERLSPVFLADAKANMIRTHGIWKAHQCIWNSPREISGNQRLPENAWFIEKRPTVFSLKANSLMPWHTLQAKP